MKRNRIITIVTESEPAMEEVMKILEKKRDRFNKMLLQTKEKIKSKNI